MKILYNNLKSKVLKSYIYLSKKNVLILEFTSGNVYGYKNFPHSAYLSFLNSKSKGYFFNKRIKEKFASSKLN